jgi:UDP:flavonoid glycosyltransferase YjiC (YdhE family)
MTVFRNNQAEVKNNYFPEIQEPAILVTPLDWGLGHATRCIPIIRKLLWMNQPVLLGGCGDSLRVLRLEFPTLPYVEFPEYNMRYPKENMLWNVALKLPQLLSTFVKEQQLVKALVKKNKIKAVISDNRYGCFHSAIPSVLITHQVYPIVPLPSMEKGVQKYVLHLINQFNVCWIPDMPAADTSLAGKLAHPAPVNAKFIGPLSRLFPQEINPNPYFNVLFLLSGPEPQRTYLENKIREQVVGLAGNFALVQGLPYQANTAVSTISNLTVFPYLQAQELSELIGNAEIILCRAGYSTLMDLAFFDKKAIFVPTPGQTEQLYLAEQLHEANRGVTISQDKLNLKEIIEKAKLTRGLPSYMPTTGSDLLEGAIRNLLGLCHK